MTDKLRILHLAIDEKFVDSGYSNFERVFPNQNTVMVVGSKEFKFIKNPSFLKIPFTKTFSPSFIKSVSSYDIVIVHSLIPQWWRVIKKISSTTRVLWIGWGFDYYDLIYSEIDQLLLEKTRPLQKGFNKKQKTFKKIKSLTKKLMFGGGKLSVISHIHGFAPVLQEDYGLVQGEVGDVLPPFFSWNYGSLEQILLNDLTSKQVNGKNILVGNSATIENNHLDAFELISNLGKGNTAEVIAPLSYGKNDYAKKTVDAGRRFFGEKFKPLMDFMTLDEYLKTIQSCNVVIMNHLRQQALGNIIIMLHLGAKVFLREECPTYKFFKGEGAFIYSIQKLASGHETMEGQLSKKEIEHNRSILRKNWCQQIIDEKTRSLVNQLLKETAHES